MTMFTIHALRHDGQKVLLQYDNQLSTLTWQDGRLVVPVRPGSFRDATVVSVTQPGRKSQVSILKISLGLSCNYECSYCNQRFVPHADASNPDEVEPFISQLTDALIESPERIEFWGGEPLVYWKTLKPLAERLRSLYPDAQFSVITNGSLLDAQKNEWLDRMGFSVGLSHDGPGQSKRGPDPLDDPGKYAAIMDLYARLHPKGRISINAMVHSSNQSRAQIQVWLQQRFGQDVNIGEGAFIDPYDEGGLAATLQTQQDHVRFRTLAYKELRQGLASRMSVAQQRIMDFVQSIRSARPATSLGQKCGMDKSNNLAVDLHGKVITCQNVSAAAIAPNGQPHQIGHLSNLQAVKMRSATHWSHRADCPSCPVLQLCKGSCMFLQGKLWDAGCDAAYSDNVPFLAAAIEYLTGCIPYYIDGDFREDRKDIFRQVHGVPEQRAKRVIPILAYDRTVVA
jgi:uncharacterized protein